ncbi:MAG: hypothetical protein K8R31_08650 [Bacteroidales bacterium]|nr:hypothetical protein [Bacteroidales bacterium]
MKRIEKYFDEKEILKYLYKWRAKIANQKSKKHLLHLLSDSASFNYHKIDKLDFEIEISKVLPSRKKWKRIGQSERYNGNGLLLNSKDKNIKSLQKTVNFYKKHSPEEPFLKNLNELVRNIQNELNNQHLKIDSPEIIPKVKDLNEKTCRPISLFKLKDKLLICLANKYLTDLFDPYFYNKSFAFRPAQLKGEYKEQVTHHDAFNEIIKYREKFKGKELYVAECDMKKFYDSVNHKIIKKAFRKFIWKVRLSFKNNFDKRVEKIFYEYLNCYQFNNNVYPLNNDNKYFESHKLKDFKYEWIEEELKEKNYYNDLEKENIGVPQGGALSGLITNIVLDYADKAIEKLNSPYLLYLRYCDDMIVIHPDKQICEKALNIYINALKELKLVPHENSFDISNKKKMWDAKTKGPYKWTLDTKTGVSWIGFVGYEIDFDGNLRIRKKSFKKEKQKQYETIKYALILAKKGDQRKKNKSIEESIINRLIGMSIGRVKIWNYKKIENEMCWTNGFKLLNDNKYSRKQLKSLDYTRNRLLMKLNRRLNKFDDTDIPANKIKSKKDNSLWYGAPFSYYYHSVKKENE